MTLNIIWFILIAVLLGGYAVLDGFDLGVGATSLFIKDPNHKRILMNSIGPLWDGNEVWLLTGGGALFAAFPHVYASAFSGLYIALMLVLLFLISRGIALEFRNKVDSQSWKKLWDLVFGISSLVLPVLFGVAIGNLLTGLPVRADMNIEITLFQLLMPYPVLIGVLTLVLFILHGSLFALNKTEGELNTQIKKFATPLAWIFALLWIVTSIATIIFEPQAIKNFQAMPILYIFSLLILIFALLIPSRIKKENFKQGFIFSFLITILAMTTFAISMFPNFIPSTIDPNYSLNLSNGASSQMTLTIMLIIAAIGMPVVIGYTIWINRVYRGKVKIDEHSY